MPFLIRPPLNYFLDEPDDAQLTYTIIEPDDSERTILRDLQAWGWRITRHDFTDQVFIEGMTAIEKNMKKRRRQSHVVGDRLLGYEGRPTLEELWEREAEKAFEKDLNGVKQRDGMTYPDIQKVCGENHMGEIIRGYSSAMDSFDAGPLSTHLSSQQNHQDQRHPLAHHLEYRTEKVENYLHATTLPAQINAYLNSFDDSHLYPRLLTHGLEHRYTDKSEEPAWRRYQRGQSRFIPHGSESELGTRSKIWQTPPAYHRDVGVGGMFPCCTTPHPHTRKPRFRKVLDKGRDKALPRLPDDLTQQNGTMIFPEDGWGVKEYVRRTRRPIRGTGDKAPSLSIRGLRGDPYGWLKWDQHRHKANDGKALLKFVRREKCDMNDQARIREELVKRRRIGEEIISGRGRREDGLIVRKEVQREPDEVVMFRSAWNSFY